MSRASGLPERGALPAGWAARFVHQLDGARGAGEPTIALTFDDGPSTATVALLDALAGAQATFLLVGDLIADQPDVVGEIGARGHSIGIHGWSHTSFEDLTDEDLADELDRCAELVARLSGTRPRLVRPPYGHVDTRSASIVRERGFTPVLWSVDPRDWAEPGIDVGIGHGCRGRHSRPDEPPHEATAIDATPQVRADQLPLDTLPPPRPSGA